MTTTLTGAPARYKRGLHELADGVWAWLQPNGGLGEANAGLIAGDGTSLLVDTLWDRRLATEMLAAMRPLLAVAPLRTIVNTHSDGDHWWGNAAMPREAQIITSQRSAAAMDVDVSPRGLARLTTTLKVASRLPGSIGERARRAHQLFSPFDFDDVRLRRPDRTYTGEEILDVGGRDVRLVEVGPAHTPGDLIVHVADASVVFAADVLFVGVTPIMWTGPVGGLLAALDLLLDIGADVYVPGHGPSASREDVELMAGYWRWVRDRASEQHARGRSRLDACRAIAAHEGFARWREWDEPERVVVNVDSMFRELDRRPPVGPRSPQKLALFKDMETLRSELPLE